MARSPGPDLDDTRARKSDTDHLRAQARAADNEHQQAYEQGRADRKAGHPRDHSEPFDEDLTGSYHAGWDDEDTDRTANKSGDDGHQAQPDSEGLAAGYPPAPAPRPSSSAGGFSVPKTELGHQGAGFLLGLFSYALVLNYLRYGWAGDTAWLKAKFLNQTSKLPAAGGTTVLVPNAGLTPAGAPTGGPAPQAGGVIA